MKTVIKKQIKEVVPQKWIDYGYQFFFFMEILFRHVEYRMFGKKILNIKDVPIIINNFNRLEYLLKLINSLTSRGYNNIYIIDNASTYPPLLDYYEKTPYPVFKLKENIGYLALWKTNIFKKFKNSYYVYTDSDMEIEDFCPDDFMNC